MNDLTPTWQPVLASRELRAGDNIVAAIAQGQELALWRSTDGAVQAWEDRCPHRGTRLSLGRIVDDRLACAYHGWEFEAGDGRCAAIPAHPGMTAPRSVCVKTFAAAESQGMIWIQARTSDAEAPTAPTRDDAFLCRTMGVRASAADAEAALRSAGFTSSSPGTWRGELGRLAATIHVTDAQPQLSFLHAWLDARPAADALSTVFAALRLLRRAIEQAA